jgi:hypothetical protein
VGVTSAEFGEQHRARWVILAGTAADETGLPADPGFRSAFASRVEWVSRAALAQARSGAAAQPRPGLRTGQGPGEAPLAGSAAAGSQGEPREQQPLPGPDEPVGFAAHIKPLFRQRDRRSMSFAFDLWSYDAVRTRAADILRRLTDGSMPCDGAWPADRVKVFQRWIDSGMEP